jgi:predicted O-methyltransferase YrrM
MLSAFASVSSKDSFTESQRGGGGGPDGWRGQGRAQARIPEMLMLRSMDNLRTLLARRVTPRAGKQPSGDFVDLLQQHINDHLLPEVQRQTNAILDARAAATAAETAHFSGLDAGGPFGPIPRSFSIVPEALRCCEALASADELAEAHAIRSSFAIGNNPEPWMGDVIRAFRLIKGRRTYLEIGTEDRGNLAFASTLLAEDAILIGIDIRDNPIQDDKLRSFIKPTQAYLPIVGDSRLLSTFAPMEAALQGHQLDAVFIDADHTAHSVVCDYTNAEALVQNDGVIMLHDSLWEGGGLYKGTADALAEINTVDPVYLIDATSPPRRFMRAMWKASLWGVVGVVFAWEQRWRQT